MIVDWRNRFGRNWITSVRDQGGSQNCWAFAVTGLYEAMIRIEHLLWARRSEGEVARGAGKQPWDTGNIGEGMTFVERYGLADPDCFPWSDAAALYTGKPHGTALTALPMAVPGDRPGRQMRIGAGTGVSVTDPAQKKSWIDLVGPMAFALNLPADFAAYGGGIYTHTIGGATVGGHVMLCVGFDDDARCWIVKNSWGPTRGEQGFWRMSYDARDSAGNVVAGAGLLEGTGFVGVRGVSPDPWAKRRLRNGTLVQGANGGRRNNFELFVRVGTDVEHWFRDNAAAGLPWQRVGQVRSGDVWRGTFGNDVIDCPAAVQSSFNRNFELVLRTTYRQLRHVYYDQTSGWWSDLTIFGPTDPVGIPGFIQSNHGAPGSFEVIAVTQAGQAQQWTKQNGPPWTRLPGEWRMDAAFGSTIRYSGPSLIQSKLGVVGSPENGTGELHYVGTGSDGRMQHWRRPGPHQGSWAQIGVFGSGATSAPCLIEGTYGAGNEANVGNFELCVVAGDRIEHWWRYNRTPGDWVRSAVFGDGVSRVVGMLQSSIDTNLELIVERRDGRFQHYWRDAGGWHAGVVVV